MHDEFVEEVAPHRGHHHHDAHREDPDEQLHLHRCGRHGQHDERDERHASDAIGFEPVHRRADRVARVVARAVGDDARIARIVFLDLEHDLHQVAADVGDLREDAAGDAEGGSAQGLPDRKADETRAGQLPGDEQQDGEHHEQLDRDE